VRERGYYESYQRKDRKIKKLGTTADADSRSGVKALLNPMKEGFVMKIKLLWREKEARQSFYSAILISLMLCLFWVFLFVGICAEQDRREGQQKSNRKWAQERAVNQYETEQAMKVVPRQETELMKAMRQAAK